MRQRACVRVCQKRRARKKRDDWNCSINIWKTTITNRCTRTSHNHIAHSIFSLLFWENQSKQHKSKLYESFWIILILCHRISSYKKPFTLPLNLNWTFCDHFYSTQTFYFSSFARDVAIFYRFRCKYFCRVQWNLAIIKWTADDSNC